MLNRAKSHLLGFGRMSLQQRAMMPAYRIVMMQPIRPFSTEAQPMEPSDPQIPQEIPKLSAEPPKIYWDINKHYKTSIKAASFPKGFNGLDLSKDIIPKEKAIIKDYGLLETEVKYLVQHKPSILIYDQEYEQHKRGIKALWELWTDPNHRHKLGKFDADLVRNFVIKYPPILGKSQDEIKEFFKILSRHGIQTEEAMRILISTPKLISVNKLEDKIKEVAFLFELYHKMTVQDTIKIFRAFPYMYVLRTKKIQRFLGEFKKYKMTRKQIMNLCMNSQGILGCKVGTFIGLFDVLKNNYGIKAQQVLKILDVLPEFALQNRRDHINIKMRMIQHVSNKDDIYMRHMVLRHPDILMK